MQVDFIRICISPMLPTENKIKGLYMLRSFFLASAVLLTSVILHDANADSIPVETTTSVAVSEARILADIKYLADDEREGRGVGTEGQADAAKYIAKAFADAGLKVPKGEDDSFLEFTTPTRATLGKTNSLVLTLPGKQPVALKMSQSFSPCSFGASGKFNAGLVFCGYGISLQRKYDDYAGIDVRGKVAVILRRVPGQAKKRTGLFYNLRGRVIPEAALVKKVQVAAEHGAVGVLFVSDPYTIKKSIARIAAQKAAYKKKIKAEPAKADQYERILKSLKRVAVGDRLLPFGYGGAFRKPSVPSFHITNAQCNVILKSVLNKTIADLESEIDSNLQPRSVALKGVRVTGEATVKREDVKSVNVIGVLPGSGPYAEETIVIGAHYDHLGRGGRGSLSRGSTDIHNGADDNGSGTTLLLELARRLAKHKDGFKRRVVLIAFAGEEMGLLGSKAYVANPVIPLNKTVAMFNFDMVGRVSDNTLTIFGTGTSDAWKPALDSLEKKHRFAFNRKSPGMGPSDHHSFYTNKIPVLHCFTGLHGDYHRPSDDWQKINVQGIRRVTDLVEDLVVQTANANSKPNYVSVPGRANPLTAAGRVPFFGSIPSLGFKGEGYQLLKVIAGSPAAKAGLKAGDVVLQFDGRAVESVESFMAALKSHSAKQVVEISIVRGDEKLKLKVTLGRPH